MMREPIAGWPQDEKGIALVMALLFLLVLTLIGISAVSTATFDNIISGNERISTQTFYVAEAGINEFVGRFRPGVSDEIVDNTQSQLNPDPNWRLFLARNSAGAFDIVDNVTEKPKQISYGSGLNDILVPSLENLQDPEDQMDYGVVARHKVDDPSKPSPSTIFKAMMPVYIVTSHGRIGSGGNKVIEVEINKIRQDFGKPGALYSKSPVLIRGSSTYITGIDQCPQDGVYKNRAGVEVFCRDCVPPTIDDSAGNPEIFGDPPKLPDSSNNIPLREMLDYLKSNAMEDELYYQYNKNTILTGSSLEESSWGYPIKSPTNPTETPLAYDGPMNVVYFNMQGGNTLK